MRFIGVYDNRRSTAISLVGVTAYVRRSLGAGDGDQLARPHCGPHVP